MRNRPTCKKRPWTLCLAVFLMSFVAVLVGDHGLAQNPKSNQASLVVGSDQPEGIINRNIYGQFAEHLGRLIYEGLWIGEDSSIPNTGGLRSEVIAALEELQSPVLRWPLQGNPKLLIDLCQRTQRLSSYVFPFTR
jgi:hypothetical protein